MRKKTAYVCGTAFNHELGETTIWVFKTVKVLKQKEKCWKECGIYQVEFKEVKEVVKPKLFKSSKQGEKK